MSWMCEMGRLLCSCLSSVFLSMSTVPELADTAVLKFYTIMLLPASTLLVEFPDRWVTTLWALVGLFGGGWAVLVVEPMRPWDSEARLRKLGPRIWLVLVSRAGLDAEWDVFLK